MKVSELIAELQCYDEDAEVHITHGSGDYWWTRLAPKIRQVFNGYVTHTNYHQTFKLIDDREGEDDIRTVVVIE